jgi:hypothetical protein
MKSLAALVIIGSAVLIALLIIVPSFIREVLVGDEWDHLSQTQHYLPPPPNPTVIKIYSLLPSQTQTVMNSDWAKIEIHSEYPVQFISGMCQSGRVVQADCDGPPHDLFIHDLRIPQPFFQPRANTVIVKFTRY